VSPANPHGSPDEIAIRAEPGADHARQAPGRCTAASRAAIRRPYAKLAREPEDRDQGPAHRPNRPGRNLPRHRGAARREARPHPHPRLRRAHKHFDEYVHLGVRRHSL